MSILKLCFVVTVMLSSPASAQDSGPVDVACNVPGTENNDCTCGNTPAALCRTTPNGCTALVSDIPAGGDEAEAFVVECFYDPQTQNDVQAPFTPQNNCTCTTRPLRSRGSSDNRDRVEPEPSQY